MNKENYLLILLLIITSFTSCKKDDLAYRRDFEKSYSAWSSFKKATHNSYRYTIAFGSWTGYGTETTFTINDGKVVKRSFVAKNIERTSNQLVIVEQWDEEEAKLNTHQTGYPVITLDEIYQKAKTEWLTKRANAKTYFEANNNGMISSCGFVEDNCADDCFNGITITNITKL